ncbi:alkaline phytoceramidase [Aspergillus campestris IBT 28561]|uniref:Alkaline phytoceramidase n=1 Tax=Aspergillus campestris (strain IBT 28561) TaxID=1392248 RepID=A0A2I1D480_ASPC2|nr:alkaline phytoceramidase [Aspergillus campestris IBT 28561]PKY04679.1 alkaline phytoceramidase [Aspergillus campestris IBT 28561]
MNAINLVDCFWGAPTSKVNFCEADYAISRYIAEFVNSLTNVIYIIYGIYGLRQLRQNANKYVDPLRALPYWGLIAVGLCSFAFHASLKYHTQMMDDVSMHFATTPVLHRVLTTNSNRRDFIITTLVLVSTLLLLILFHIITDELVLHSVLFVGTVTFIGVYTIRLINSRTLPDSPAWRQTWGMAWFGIAIFNFGYWLWLADQWACSFLTRAREAIGLPWAFLLELHGWWHICTGIGAYTFIAVIDLLLSDDDIKDITQSFAWPASWASTSIFAGCEPSVDKEVGEKQK